MTAAKKRISLVHANVAYRVLARIQVLAERAYRDSTASYYTVEQRTALQQNGRELSRMVGRLEYEIFGSIMYTTVNPLVEVPALAVSDKSVKPYDQSYEAPTS